MELKCKWKKKKQEKKEADKEYYVFINGEKWLVRLVTEEDQRELTVNDSDSSIKETKQPKTLKPFYSVWFRQEWGEM